MYIMHACVLSTYIEMATSWRLKMARTTLIVYTHTHMIASNDDFGHIEYYSCVDFNRHTIFENLGK
jgi:hypothetical protein